MTINTHLEINQDLCGRVTELQQGRCTLELEPTAQMRADDRGLVHGGFISERQTTQPCSPSTTPTWCWSAPRYGS